MLKGREKRIARERQRMFDVLAEGGADVTALEIIQRPALRTGRWARLLGRDVELIARSVVR